MKWNLNFLGGTASVSREAAEFAIALDRLLQSHAARSHVRPMIAAIKTSADGLDQLEKAVGRAKANEMIAQLFPTAK